MVERAALEMRYTRKRIEGSNPPLSAKKGRFVCLSLLKQANRSFILNDNFRQFGCQLSSIQGGFCFCSNEMQLYRIWRAKQN